jgi:AAA domain
MRRLADREHLAAYCREVTRLTGLPVELIVIDTVARAMAGANENAPDAMSDFVNVIDRLRKQTGAHVALIHHSGKDPTKGARGHSSLLGALDSEFEIKKQGDNAGLITSTAQRDIEDNVSFQFTRKIVPLGMDAKGRVVTSCQITISPAGREQVDTWPKSLRLFRKCLLEAIESDGEEYRPNGKRGPVVQAVAVDVVRELHRQQYVSAGDMDATVAASQAWRRAWTKATTEKLVGAANVGARAVVWYGQ